MSISAPVPSPPQVRMMQTGYTAPQFYPQPQPQVVYVKEAVKNVTNNTKAAKTVNSIGKTLMKYVFQFTASAILLMVIFAVVMKATGLDDWMKDLAPWAGPIITGLLAITGVGALTKAGFFGKAKKAKALAEEAKAARKAGDIKKAKKLEQEAKAASEEAEAAKAAKAAKAAEAEGRALEEGAEAAKAAKVAREGEQGLAEIKNLVRII